MNSLSKMLREQIKEMEQNKEAIVNSDVHRLNFHLMPPVGWLNDPNGLSYHNGEYHVFFQYSPECATGGLKQWGHYKSKDLLNWDYMGTPLLSDQPFDCHGAYSGCGFSEEGTFYLFYTGNVKHPGDYDYIHNGRGSNTILAELNETNQVMKKTCVLSNEQYPKEYTCHIRDPKVWKQGKQYYMVLGARDKKDQGNVLVYQSNNKYDWKLVNIIASDEPFGYMWECPDVLFLGEHTLLSVSPQGVEADGIQYENRYQSGYYFVEGDVTEDCHVVGFQEWDRGFDFYAPQTFVDEKGRCILIGWMGMPDCEPEYTNPTIHKGWQHALTIPRVITTKGKNVLQQPVEELKQLRTNEQTIQNGEATTNKESYELYVDSIQSHDCTITISDAVVFQYNQSEQLASLRFLNNMGAGRTKRSVKLEYCNNIRVFVDRSSIEVFMNDGEEVFSTRFYPVDGVSKAVIHCESSNNTVWELKHFTIKKGENR